MLLINMPLQNLSVKDYSAKSLSTDNLPSEMVDIDSVNSLSTGAMTANDIQAISASEFTNELNPATTDSNNLNEPAEKLNNALPFGYQGATINEELTVESTVTDEGLSELVADESIDATLGHLNSESVNPVIDSEVTTAASQEETQEQSQEQSAVLQDAMENEQIAINNQVQEELSSVANPATASLAAANSANTAVASNAANADKPANSINAQSTGLNQQTSWGAQSAEAGQAANSGNQSSANQNSASSQSFAGNQQMAQQMVQQQEQKSQALNQQAALKMGEELAAKTETKDISLTGDFGATGERRQTLPIGLQTINVPVKSPQWSQAVAHRVSFMANNQIQQAQITLNPEKLGPIQIKLQIDRDQQVQVSMLASQTTTREALEAAMPRLREMLEQSGMNLVSVDISDDKQFAEQQSEQGETHSSASTLNGNSEESDEGMVAVKSVESDNIVDYYA